MNKPLRLGIAGLGTVGIGVIKIIQRDAALISARAGRNIVISAVSARYPSKQRDVDLSRYSWEADPIKLAQRTDVDIFVELIGGADGVGKDSVEAAIAARKDVVTANKAMLAHHGQHLAEQAESGKTCIRFEAAVAGGIPVVKSLSEGLSANTVSRVMGVMNGTCNFILTRMERAGLPYEQAFAEAHSLGYLESDPRLDIDGIDAGHKLALLAAIAFGTRPDFNNVDLEGIDQVSIEDIHAAADMGFKIKLLGVAQRTTCGLEQRMHPCLVPATSPLGQLDGGTNMIVIESSAAEQIVLSGPGAGEGPTASAVIGDVCDLARGLRMPVFGQSAKNLTAIEKSQSELPAPYYLRMSLLDKPGSLAKIAGILGENSVSIDRMRQKRHDSRSAPVIIVTHKATPAAIGEAIDQMSHSDTITDPPVAFRIEHV